MLMSIYELETFRPSGEEAVLVTRTILRARGAAVSDYRPEYPSVYGLESYWPLEQHLLSYRNGHPRTGGPFRPNYPSLFGLESYIALPEHSVGLYDPNFKPCYKTTFELESYRPPKRERTIAAVTPPPPRRIFRTPQGVMVEPPDWEVSHFEALVTELRDDNAKSRLREAFWVSVIVHMVVLFSVHEAPRFLPKRAPVVMSAEDLLKQRELTYLAQPPDIQKPKLKTQSDQISDKDRVATSRTPQIDKDTLEKLRQARRPDAPGSEAQPTPQQMASAQSPQQQMSQNPGQQQGAAAQQPTQNDSRFQTPVEKRPQQPNFSTGSSARTAMQQAAQSSSQSRTATAGGFGGDYGAGPGHRGTQVFGNMEVLSDTMGVDFASYLERVKFAVQKNWYLLIPLFKQGVLSIEFVIMKNGTVQGMRLSSPSGDVSLDRAAWGGITNSNPFQALPPEFKGEYIALRFRFYYNPDRNDMR